MTNAKRASASVVRGELTAARIQWGWSPSEVVALLRGGGDSGKGSNYERELCKLLSLWWSHGARDDIFWRSSSSGARAKVRGRGGKGTAGQHGDVAATDPAGAVFTDLFTVEIKRGYNEHTAQDLIDRPDKAGVQVWEGFFTQTIESHQQAGSYAWLLLTRRDRREAIVWIPRYVLMDMRRHGAWPTARPVPYIEIAAEARGAGTIHGNRWFRHVHVAGMLLNAWLEEITPEIVASLAKEQGAL